MHASLRLTIALFLLLAMTPLLGACNTTAGLGKDISATGQAIQAGAQKATP